MTTTDDRPRQMRSEFWTDWQRMEADRRRLIKLLRSGKPIDQQARTALARQLEHCTPVPEFRGDRA
jgi:hypothetical protein